ncbi:hypothetical protein L226DRAFT_562963 [Lentinus tigrinus ALCF2SS1-7]|uniref:Uncharacterized protein n=1 Tax=Lentinus tigrinus ALCF2SS1-6 TaxID=1328759 RepID=A0A5C2RU99_9APHY|nr:hypothetical protein L227DRAFT_657044 [Lentinus tigrinus ALCF2SS1-6]RPD70095.1 hypothetical protein L226DRAFT_562963 [Lentinus tigrinus ALCF2SS1-7]
MNALLRLLLSVYHFILHHMIDGIRKAVTDRWSPSRPNGQGSHRTTRSRHQDQRSDVASFKAALEAKEQELDRRARKLEELQRILEREKESGRKWKEQCDSARTENQQLRTCLSEKEGEAQRSAARLSELQRANTHLEKERGVIAAILETRTSELKEAQAFLTKADDVADSELLRMMDALNSKIFQTAASLAEAPQFRYGRKSVDEVEHAAQKLERDGWLGPHLLSALRSIDHTHDPVLVQTALQAVLTMYVRWLAMSWDLGHYDPEGMLYKLYTVVRQRVPQSVAGRWRALCRESAKVVGGIGDTEAERHARKLARLTGDVLIACGVSGSSDAVYAMVKKAFLSPLHEISERALEFQRITGEDILSCDLITVVVLPDTAFDRARMEDEWADPKVPSSDGLVLCTTQLGLMREEKKTEGIQATLLRRPKVVLKSMLEQLWDEMSDYEHQQDR